MQSVHIFFTLLLMLSGCAAQTGSPGHGGGKRFAIEQELVSAATRAAIKQIDLTKIRGKKVNLFVNAIGDSGAGNLVGGRFSVVSQLHGDYIQSPPVKETYIYPKYTSTSSTSSTTNSSQSGVSAGSSTHSSSQSSTTQNTTSDTLLPAPSSKVSQQDGSGSTVQVGMEYKGLGAYHNSEEFTSDDLHYLTAILQTYLYLQGVYVVPPSEAEIDVYVTVDVFGTVYTRVEWFLANNEILKAKTALEVLAVDHLSGALVMEPRSAAAESEYTEQYILWAGPVRIRKTVNKAEPMLADFSDLTEPQPMVPVDRRVPVAYPFKHEIEKR